MKGCLLLLLLTTSCGGQIIQKGVRVTGVNIGGVYTPPTPPPLLFTPTLTLTNSTLNNTSACAASNAAVLGTTSCQDNFPAGGARQTVFPVSTSSRTTTSVTIKIVDNYNFATTDKVIVSGLGGTFTGGTYQITALGACTSSGAADCTITYTQGSGSASSTGGTATRYAQMDPYIPAPANVAGIADGVDVHDLPYYKTGGTSTAWMAAHFMPWFSCAASCIFTNADGTSSSDLDHGINQSQSHATVGYVSNSTNQITEQINAMKRIGLNGLIGDSSGLAYTGASTTRKNEIAVFDKVAAILAGQSAFQFAVLLDDSSFKTSATCLNTLTPLCVGEVIEDAFDYWHYGTSSTFTSALTGGTYSGSGFFDNTAYKTIGGKPITGTFMSEGSYFTSCLTATPCAVLGGATCSGATASAASQACFTALRAHVTTHQSAWTTKPIYFWRNSFSQSTIGSTADAGSYRWINPTGNRSNTDLPGYKSWLTSAGSSSRHSMSTIYAHNDHAQSTFQNDNLGFESYCGQTYLDSASAGYDNGTYAVGNEPDGGFQFLTWNDIEQGTMIETGIKGCYGISASIAGATISYNLTSSDATYAPIPLNTAKNATLDHIAVLAVKAGGAVGASDTMKLTDISIPASGSGTFDMSAYPFGTGNFTIYLKLVPRAGMQTAITSGQSYVVP